MPVASSLRSGTVVLCLSIGAAWAHENGPGYSIRLDALPVDGRLVLVAPSEPKAGDAA